MMQEKINVLRDSENYVGKYFSKAYINRTILGFSEEQVKQMQEEIEKENKESAGGVGPGEDEFTEVPMQNLQ